MSIFTRLLANTTEQESFKWPKSRGDLVVSPDSRRVAYPVSDRRGEHVEVNGKALSPYDRVSGITFSPDSRHLAYAAQRRDKWFVVVDATEREPFDGIAGSTPVFSPDSKRIAYGACRGSDWFAVLDNDAVGGPFEGFSPGGIVFSQDSSRTIYVIERGDAWVAVVDQREEPPFKTILERSWAFSPDSKHWAYAAAVCGERKEMSRFVGECGWVIDGNIQETWKHNELQRTDGLFHELYFSPDSMRTAYGVSEKSTFSFVVDGVRQPRYANLASGWHGSPMWKYFPDHDKAGPRSEAFVFSPDSQHYAYAVHAREGESFLIYDRERKGPYQTILCAPPVFSPDSKRLAYRIQKGYKQSLVVDWRAMAFGDSLPPIGCAFSPRSDKIAYVAADGDVGYVVVDSRTWRLRGGPVVGAKMVWDDDQHLHTLLAKGRRIELTSFSVE
jgi:WD40 repeat protein